jgi:acetyl esterase/lipase
MEDRSVLSREARQPDAELYFGDPARPTVVLIHGGFWRPEYDLTHLRPMASALSALGWPVCLIEYPRVPGRPDLATAGVAAAAAAYAGREIVLMGHSAGGHLALWAAQSQAAHNQAAHGQAADGPLARDLAAGQPAARAQAGAIVRGVIALAPVADLALARSLGLDDGAVDDFLGACPVGDYQPEYEQATLIHGMADALVPVALSESYQGRHPLARLIRVPGAGHFALIDPISDAWPMMIEELDRLLA